MQAYSSQKTCKLMYNMFLRFWQWFPSHSLVHRHTPGDIQLPPFSQGGLNTAIGENIKNKRISEV